MGDVDLEYAELCNETAEDMERAHDRIAALIAERDAAQQRERELGCKLVALAEEWEALFAKRDARIAELERELTEARSLPNSQEQS